MTYFIGYLKAIYRLFYRLFSEICLTWHHWYPGGNQSRDDNAQMASTHCRTSTIRIDIFIFSENNRDDIIYLRGRFLYKTCLKYINP